MDSYIDEGDSLRGRVTRQSEEALGRLAQELLDNRLVTGALSAAFETRERAARAQEVAMGALNLPSAADLERLTRRVRSVSQRLEGIEDGIDRLDDRLERADPTRSLDERLTKIEEVLARLEADRKTAAEDGARTAKGAQRTNARSTSERSTGDGASGRAKPTRSRRPRPAA